MISCLHSQYGGIGSACLPLKTILAAVSLTSFSTGGVGHRQHMHAAVHSMR